MKRCERIEVPLLVLSLRFPAAGAAEFVGLDANGDQQCGPEDTLFQADAADVGTTRTLGVFFDDLAPVCAYQCTFCITDRDKIAQVAWTYTPLESWFYAPAFDSDDNGFSVELSAYIPERYPNYLCWLVGGVEPTLSNPISGFPCTIGNLTYEVAEDGCLQWLLDVGNLNVGVQTTSFQTITFNGPGEACDTVSCSSTTATEAASWGSVKSLFR
jgi:hypothetical protein